MFTLILFSLACVREVPREVDTAAVAVDEGPGCVPLQRGPWTGQTGFGHESRTTLFYVRDDCRLWFEWLDPDDKPEGGDVVDDVVTLYGEGWEDCTGIAESAEEISGDCPDGSLWWLTFGAFAW